MCWRIRWGCKSFVPPSSEPPPNKALRMPPPPDLELELSLPSKSDRKSSKSDRKSWRDRETSHRGSFKFSVTKRPKGVSGDGHRIPCCAGDPKQGSLLRGGGEDNMHNTLQVTLVSVGGVPSSSEQNESLDESLQLHSRPAPKPPPSFHFFFFSFFFSFFSFFSSLDLCS